MKKLFLVTAVFFLAMITHSEAQLGQKELQIEKASLLLPQSTFKTQCAGKIAAHCLANAKNKYCLINLKNKTRKWKSEMTASTKGYGIAKLRGCKKPSAQQLIIPTTYSFQGNYGHIKQPIYVAPATQASEPSLTLRAPDANNDDNGVNITLSKKATLSFDFGADPSEDSTDILADNSIQDIDISVGLSLDLR